MPTAREIVDRAYEMTRQDHECFRQFLCDHVSERYQYYVYRFVEVEDACEENCLSDTLLWWLMQR